MRLRTILSAIAWLALLAPAPAVADDPDFLRLAIGRFDVNDDQKAVEFRAEYQSAWKLWIIKPFGGIMGTSDRALYGYGGFLVDIYLGRRFVLTPSLAFGLYEEGDGKDLGHIVEFRSSAEIAYRFDDRSRIGLSLYHLSNASLSDDNQGTEIVSLSYSIPLSRPPR